MNYLLCDHFILHILLLPTTLTLQLTKDHLINQDDILTEGLSTPILEGHYKQGLNYPLEKKKNYDGKMTFCSDVEGPLVQGIKLLIEIKVSRIRVWIALL